MIIEGRHPDAGQGIFVSDIQEGSPAHQAGLAIGDMILSVNQHDLVGADYERAVQILKSNEGTFTNFFLFESCQIKTNVLHVWGHGAETKVH